MAARLSDSTGGKPEQTSISFLAWWSWVWRASRLQASSRSWSCPASHPLPSHPPFILALRRVSRAETSAVRHSTLVMGGVPLIMEMRGAEDPSVLRFIGELHNSFREALCRNEPQCGVFALPEELLPLPHNEWMDREIEHVEQVVPQQRLSEKTMAIDEKIPSFLLLELGHFSNHIASHNGRVGPFGCFQLRREHILWYGIDPVGPRVGPSGPNLRKALVCVPAHQHRIARQQLPQSIPQIRIVAVLKKSRDICSCENAVYRDQGIFDNFPHKIVSFHKDVPRSRNPSRFWKLGRSRCCTRSKSGVCQWCLHLFISFQCLFVVAVPFSPDWREVSIPFHL